jgi:PKD repeat protein
MIRYWNTLLLILFFSGIAFAQNAGNSCTRSTEGTEFWFGFMESRHHQTGHYLELTLTSTYACQFKLYVGSSTSPYWTGTMQPNVPYRIQLPWPIFEPLGSEIVEKKAIHIVSDKPMNIFAMNWSPSSADAAVIFPVDAIGNEYYAMCYEPSINEGAGGVPGNGKNSEFLIVASEDNTVVSITPSKVTDQLRPANVPFTVKLNKGELYQVQSMNHANLAGQGDLTGSYIKSDKPVAFYSGSWSTTIPNTSNSAWDHLYEQIPPVRSWGRKFVTVPLKGRSLDRFRVLASENNTIFRIGKNTPVMLNKGEFYEFVLTENQPSLIDSDHPVLLAQYMVSNSVDRPANVAQTSWDGDPLMLIVSPVDQTREAVTFVAYDSPNIKSKFYVNVVTKIGSSGNILLDGQPIIFQPLPDTEYAFAQVAISKGNHNLNSSVSGEGFIAYVYGYGGVESYGYGVGFNLSIKLDLGGDIYFNKDTVLLCQGQAKILNAGSHFSKFLWSTGDTTQAIFVNMPGYYHVTASTIDGCVMRDSIYSFLSNPVVKLGNDTIICSPKTLVLDAGQGFNSYQWTTADSTRTITTKTSGSYGVLAMNKYQCPARDSIYVTFTGKPKIDLSKLDTLICGDKMTTAGISVDRGNYTLKSSDPLVVINNLEVKVPEFNTYPFYYKVVDASTCTADTSFSIGFHKTPTVTISVDDTTCYGYNLDARYLGDADTSRARFTWVFAKDTLASDIGVTRLQVKLGMDRNKRDLFLKVEEKGCPNSFIIKEISVIPDLSFTVSDTLLCQPEKFSFTATNTENVVDYFWEWGDGTSVHNGSAASHNYSVDGHYTVRLTATTDKNCINTIQKEGILYVAPVPTVDFSIKDNTCLGLGPQSLLYTGSADELDHYKWDLSGLRPGELIANPGDTKGPLGFELLEKPKVEIRLQVTSKYGCISENKSLLLKRIPKFSLSLPDSAGCIPFEADFAAVTGDKIDQVGYSWRFGDGNSGNGPNVSHTYPLPDKTYDITLFASSGTTGCRDTLFKPALITVFPKPVASFDINSNILTNEDPVAVFKNQSEGADHFIWSFDDGSISRMKDPVHKYEVVGPRRVMLESINTFECSDTISDLVMIALGRIFAPNAFSPQAPNALDRQFFPYCNGVIEKGYHLRIINRWNEVVFETENILKGWDGRLTDGSMAPTGNYVWLLNFVDFMDKRHQQNGTVTLIF